MIAALRRAAAYSGRLIEAAVNARTLARTVRILARQLDNAHLLAASEEARADRAELRVAELEAQQRDWAELSGELAAEQPAADALPDLTDAGEAPIPMALTDSAREVEIQRDRADALQRALQACEVDLVTARAQLQQTERAAGAHLATIEELREQIAAAHRAAHAPARSLEARAEIAWRAWDEAPDSAPGGAPPPEATGWDSVYPGAKAAWRAVVRACDTSAAPAEQIPGVAAADALTESERREGYQIGKQTGIGFAAGCQAIAESKARMARPGDAVLAAADTPPETRPSARIATREEPRP